MCSKLLLLAMLVGMLENVMSYVFAEPVLCHIYTCSVQIPTLRWIGSDCYETA